MSGAVILDGCRLDIETLCAIAKGGVEVTLAPEAIQRAETARQIVEQHLTQSIPVYGLNTGLGAQSGNRLDIEALSSFSLQTIRGRAHAIGTSMSTGLVRAAMAIRLNTLLKGGAGCSMAVIELLQSCLEHHITPVVGETGSIGASDLCLGATMALSLIGEGEMTDAQGCAGPSADILARYNMTPLSPAPKDGLALCNHSSFTAANLALKTLSASNIIASAQVAAALSMEGFMANITALSSLSSDLRPQQGQKAAADQLTRLLAGSAISNTANARRLQDPLSIRNVPQVHGAVFATIELAEQTAVNEMNGASDNPLVDIENEKIISCGAYYTPLATLSAQAVSQSLSHMAVCQLARMSKLLSPALSGLPQFLAKPGSNSNGFAPLMKIAESALAELIHAASQVSVWPSINADGVEDIQCHSMTAISALGAVIEKAETLTAIELLVACQARELRRPNPASTKLDQYATEVRAYVEPLEQDRPLANDVMRLATAVSNCEFAARPE